MAHTKTHTKINTYIMELLIYVIIRVFKGFLVVLVDLGVLVHF